MSKTDKKKRAILPIGGLEKTFRRQEIARMFKIVRCPEKLNSFFESLLGNFLYDHFNYFKFLVLAIAFSWERRNVADLCRYLDAEGQAHRTRFNNFLNVGRWNPESVLREKAMQILSQLKPRRGETIYFVIDDTKKEKRGKKMDAVGGIYDPVSKRNLKGHQYVVASIRFRGRTIPFGIRLYVKDRDCPDLGLTFKTTTEMAADIHLHLVCFAYALLTHIAIESDNAKGKRQRKSAKASTRSIQYELRQIVWNDLVDSFKEITNDATVFERLSRLRVAA